MRFLIFLFAIFTTALPAAAQKNSINFSPQAKEVKLFGFIQLIADPAHKLTIETVSSEDFQARFQPLSTFSNQLNTTDTYWGKLKFRNEKDEPVSWFFSPAFSSYINVYVQQPDGTFIEKKTGGLRPNSELDIPLEWFRVRITLPANEETAIYFKVRSIDHFLPDFSNASLMNEMYYKEQLFSTISHRNWTQGIFHGMLWIMIVYNLLVFASTRDKSYLYYALYLAAASSYFLFRRRFLLEYVWYEMPFLNSYAWTISVGAVSVFYYLFMRHFFNTQQDAPQIDKIIKAWIIVKIAFVVFISAIIAFTLNIRLVLAIGIFPIVTDVLLSLYILVQLRRIARQIAPYFLIGSFLLLSALLVYVAYFIGLNLGFYESTQVMLYLLEGGIVLEVIFFSLGLAHRMQVHKSEKLKAQSELIKQLRRNERLQTQVERELKQKVEERTTELQDKTSLLEHRNEEILSQRDILENQKSKIELQNKELSMKNNEMKSLNEEKNYLINIVAHDLRNPLTSALSVSELLLAESDELTSDQEECIKHINNTLQRMSTMVNRILDIKQIDAHQIDIHLEKCNLSDLLKEVTRNFQEVAQQKAIKIHLSNGEPFHADLDKGYTVQVFENLISNAIKFSETGKNVFINVSNKKQEQKVRIEVRDEGQGISQDDMSKLFGKYQRLSARPTNGESSTGLGLSIVKKYVDAMNGKVWCESEVGKGTTFVVEFERA